MFRRAVLHGGMEGKYKMRQVGAVCTVLALLSIGAHCHERLFLAL